MRDDESGEDEAEKSCWDCRGGVFREVALFVSSWPRGRLGW